MPGLQPEDHEIDGMEFSSHHLAVSWRQRQHQQPSTLTSSLSPASSQPRFDCGETAFQEGRWKGLSGLSLKRREPFLGEAVTAMPPPYPTFFQKIMHCCRKLTLNRAQHLEAESLAKLGLALREKKLGRRHPDVGRSLNTLGNIY